MPRLSQSVTSQSARMTATSVLIDQMIKTESSYREGITSIQTGANLMANRLEHGGRLESLLGNDDIEEFREHLKKLTEQNILHDRQVTTYVAALRQIANLENVEDYEQALEEAMEIEQRRLDQNSVQVHQEAAYLDMLKKLGEKTETRSNNDNDDELEVLPTESTGNGLKCPLTTTLLEDPYRNKVCKHVYSKHAILEHLKKNKRCPVAGCTNSKITKDQLEQDKETAMLVRRERTRQEHRNQQLSQNAIDMDDEDDTI